MFITNVISQQRKLNTFAMDSLHYVLNNVRFQVPRFDEYGSSLNCRCEHRRRNKFFQKFAVGLFVGMSENASQCGAWHECSLFFRTYFYLIISSIEHNQNDYRKVNKGQDGFKIEFNSVQKR